ncbi:unnamed protein product [Kluyveromyces dobzhanskii CBS 2104]|uniref:WGS project CCBQ000000000 data, contig 00015 n=1 Tax=Kluyveromyces dobzhanskii CBS 2104 TaxID=1427455 RepID=A0A0A8LBB6_9SACH|nr:unnamed protein product [Kluyveromyces dobzhanskii CBS 2104]
MPDVLLNSETPVLSPSPDGKTQLNRSPMLVLSQASDDASSLNDDLSILSRNRDQVRDSISMRRSSFDSTFNSFSTTMHTMKHGLDYSPLVDNSIYEIVMNTRFKRWLRHPTTDDIPPVVLCKNDIKDKWDKDITEYKDEIKNEYKVYQTTNNISNLNRMEQMRSIDEEKTTFGLQNTKAKAFQEIPEFYFDKEFKLDHPNFFRMLLRDFDFDANQLLNEEDKIRIESYEELQGRLTFYLDTVEGLLVSEISKSIKSFFDALEDVDKIKEYAKETVDELDSAKDALQAINEDKILTKKKVIKDLVKRKNVEKLQQGILQVKLAKEKCDECKKVYQEEKLQECLKLVNSVESLIRGDNDDSGVNDWTSPWPYKLSDISTLPGLSTVTDILNNLKVDIGGSYSLKLVNSLLEDLRTYYSSQSRNDTITKLQSRKDKTKPHLTIDDLFRETIKENLIQLIDCDQLVPAVKLYEDKFIAELKAIIKVNLPHDKQTSEDSKDGGKQTAPNGSKLSKLIQEQTSEEFQSMLVNIFTSEIELLNRLTRHQKLLLDVSLSELPTTAEQSDKMIIDLDIRKSVNEGIRIVQLRMGKIISVRRDITSTLRFDHFLQFYEICMLFMKECESISGEFLTKYLSDVLNIQIDAYLKYLQSLNLRVLRQMVEAERWTPFIVQPELQKDVNDIVSCIDLDPSNWSQFVDLNKPSPLDSTNNECKPSAGHKKSVVLGDKTFVASETLILAIKIIKTLLVLASNLPSQYARHCERQLTDILKFFNTKAIESVSSSLTDRLSTKTDKNLNIMAESLDCLAEITLLLQGYFQRTLGSKTDKYETIWKQLQQSSEKLFQSNNIPPPV